MTEWPELLENEVLLTNMTELLWRQAAPGLQQDGVLSYLVFRPNERDGRKLSVIRAATVTAPNAYEEFIAYGGRSLGTLAVTVEEVETDAGLRSNEDSDTSDMLPLGHAYIDFRPCTKREAKTSAEMLLRAALARDWAYQPT